MSKLVKLKYMLEHPDKDDVDDDVNDASHIQALHEHNDLISKLTNHSANVLQNAIIGTFKDIKKYENNDEYFKAYDRFFIDGVIDTLDDATISEGPNNLCIVERIKTNKTGNYYKPKMSIQMDDKLIRVTMLYYLRNITDNNDRELIYSYYKLHDIKAISQNIDSEDVEYNNYLKSYYGYLYEFYIRSGNTNIELLAEYKKLSESSDAIKLLLKNFSDEHVTFSYDLILNKTYKQALLDIQEFSDNLKCYAKRLYYYNKLIIYDYFRDSKGNKNYNTVFKLWDRYIRVYDLFREKSVMEGKIDNRKIDAVGRIVVREYNVYSSSASNDIRKELLKEFRAALKLIDQSANGYLLHPSP